jgi:hypothetical protein
MILTEKKLKGKRIPEVNGFIRGYAYDPDYPSLDDHVFLMLTVLPENGLLDKQFKLQYGDAFTRAYIKNIDFKPYNIYVFKRNLDIMNEILAIGSIEHLLPLEDDDSLYFPDDYSLTIENKKRALGN